MEEGQDEDQTLFTLQTITPPPHLLPLETHLELFALIRVFDMFLSIKNQFCQGAKLPHLEEKGRERGSEKGGKVTQYPPFGQVFSMFH